MHQVFWTPAARRHLREIQAYIAKDSVSNAQRVVDRIIGAVEGAREFPHAGSLVPEWESGQYREIFEGVYRIIYRADESTMRVAAVIHGARRLPDHEDE